LRTVFQRDDETEDGTFTNSTSDSDVTEHIKWQHARGKRRTAELPICTGLAVCFLASNRGGRKVATRTVVNEAAHG